MTVRQGAPGPDVEPLLDVDGVAARLNISVRHVRRLVAERRIPHLKVGNLLRFDPQEIDEWLRRLTVCSAIHGPEGSVARQPPRLGQRGARPVDHPSGLRSATAKGRAG